MLDVPVLAIVPYQISVSVWPTLSEIWGPGCQVVTPPPDTELIPVELPVLTASTSRSPTLLGDAVTVLWPTPWAMAMVPTAEMADDKLGVVVAVAVEAAMTPVRNTDVTRVDIRTFGLLRCRGDGIACSLSSRDTSLKPPVPGRILNLNPDVPGSIHGLVP